MWECAPRDTRATATTPLTPRCPDTQPLLTTCGARVEKMGVRGSGAAGTARDASGDQGGALPGERRAEFLEDAMGCSEAMLEGCGGRRARAPSVHVSCSRLILQLIKPNIPDGVSAGLLGAAPLPHHPGTDRQEGQVDGERKGFLPELGCVSRQAPEDICRDEQCGLHCDPKQCGQAVLPQAPSRQPHESHSQRSPPHR